MDIDIIRIYERLRNKYPIELTSAWKKGFHSSIDFPILSGTSALGSFEVSCDDLPSFEFYATRNTGEFLTHWHAYSAEEAEKSVIDFMEGTLALISFGQQYDR